MASSEVKRCNRLCCMNDPDKGCLLGGVECCTIGSEQVIHRERAPEDLSVEELIYVFAVRHEGKLTINAATEDDTGRVLQVTAHSVDGKRSRHFMIAHNSTPTGYEVDVFHRILKAAITDVVFPKEGL